MASQHETTDDLSTHSTSIPFNNHRATASNPIVRNPPSAHSLSGEHNQSHESRFERHAHVTHPLAEQTREIGHGTVTGQTAAADHAGPQQAATGEPSLPTAAGQTRVATHLKLSAADDSLPLPQRAGEIKRLAIEAFPQTDNWVVFYREILGVDGIVRKLYRTIAELRTWEQSAEFGEVNTMLAALRSHDTGKGDTIEAQRMITVRLPASMHEAMKLESKECGLSINKLCITKMLQPLDVRFAPEETGKPRGRKPGPQGKRTPKATAE